MFRDRLRRALDGRSSRSAFPGRLHWVVDTQDARGEEHRHVPLRIAGHAGIHAGLVGFSVWAIARPPSGVPLAMGIEFGTHFAIDALRASLGGSWSRLRDPGSKSFWYVLGLDQLAHSLVLVWITSFVAAAVSN